MIEIHLWNRILVISPKINLSLRPDAEFMQPYMRDGLFRKRVRVARLGVSS